MKKVIIVCLFLLGVNAFSQSTEAKFSELITLTISDQLLSKVFQQFVDHYNNQYKDLPSDFWDEFKKEMIPKNVLDLQIPIYKKYFTEADIDAIIIFYKTPAGQKMIKNMPALMTESVAVTTNFMETLDKRIKEKLDKHYHFQDPPPPAP